MRLLHLYWPHLPLRLARARRSDSFPTDRPVVLGGQPWTDGTVIDADPAARALGVRRGIPLGSAHRLAPEAAFLDPEPEADAAAVEAAFETLARFSPGLAGTSDQADPAFGLIEVQARKIKDMLRGDPAAGRKPYQPGYTERLLGDRSRTGEPGLMGTVKDTAIGAAQNLLDPQASTYQTHAQGLINALTRLESGAAIGEPERRRYIEMLIPNVNDNTPEKVAAKL